MAFHAASRHVGQQHVQYLSTRGGMMPMRFSEILLEGLAPDGGLVVPSFYPRVTPQELETWRPLGYVELASRLLRKYVDDIASVDLQILIERTYTSEVFGSADITPVHTFEPGFHLLRLANGPTFSFKDIALQLLGQLFEYVLTRRREELNVLAATSGDTGSSAEHAIKGRKRLRVFMLSPHEKITLFQAAQMFSLHDSNIFNIAIRGVFDECQDIVKKITGDREFKDRYKLGAVNSINWARVMAQVVYYFKAYFSVTSTNDQEVNFAVPTGNFGNALAGHVARMMGLPIRKLIVATNENELLARFFSTGMYHVRQAKDVVQTSSPSMDIAKASNLERFIFDVVDRDPAVLRKLWREVDGQRMLDISRTQYFAKIHSLAFVAGSSTHADRLATIRSIHENYGVIVDPHTADGIKVGLEHWEHGVPLVCLETALPIKFSETIAVALGMVPEGLAAVADLERQPQSFEVLDPDPDLVKAFIVQRCTES